MTGCGHILCARPGEKVERRGSVDAVFLCLVLALLAFGAVMSYSASCVYAEQFYHDGAYSSPGARRASP